MPSVVVRTIGVSVAVEGLRPAGFEPAAFLDILSSRLGEAVAGIGDPVEHVLIDRQALHWDAILQTVEEWLKTQGAVVATWEVSRCMKGHLARLDLIE